MEDNSETKMEMSEVKEVREYFKSGVTREATWRRNQLKGLLRFMLEKEKDILKVLQDDLGKPECEAYRDEVGCLIKSLNYAISGLKEWMSSKKAKLPRIALLTSAELVPEPLGVVLILSSWNFPFGLSIEPLIGAIAAGNTVVLKPSELAPTSSALLAETMTSYLDKNAIKVIQGGPEVGEKLLRHKWDKIFFTGSARVGRIVMSAAVEHLTPVVVELGGKCPSILDALTSSWDRKVAVDRIVLSKFGFCSGQVCIATDYVLTTKEFASTAVELTKESIVTMFGKQPMEAKTMSRIVNKEHFFRLKNLLSDAAVQRSVVYGGKMDEQNLTIEPTILLNPPLQAAIMTEEIFGPLLPIITLENIEDSIDFINARPKPLAIYAFTNNEQLRRRLVAETSSGSVILNDAVIQYIADALPFGGIGESGIGKYHGKFSFEVFSHYKVVARRSFLIDFWFRFPPWDLNKLLLTESSYNLDYLRLLLVILGLKRTRTNPHGIQT